MKTSIIAILFAAPILCTQLMAQGFNSRMPSIQQMLRPWEAGPLTWDEFMGEVKTDTTIYHFAWTTRLNVQRQKIGNTTYAYPQFDSYFDQTESWVLPKFQNETMLKFNQTIFDMLELYTRRATIEYNQQKTYISEISDVNVEKPGSHYMNQKISPETVEYFYTRELKKRVEQMETDTRKGTDASKLAYYAADVALELKRTHFDPEPVIENLSPGISGEIYIGANALFPKDDYYNSAFSLNMGLAFGWERHLIGLDLSIGGGSKAKQNVKTSNGMILKGKSLNVFQMYLTYGYCVGRTGYYQYYPFVGIGMNGFAIPHKNDDASSKTCEKDGFSVAAGMMFDLFLHRNVNINPYSSNYKADVSFYAIRLKPYFSMTHYNDLGWIPALNLSIMFNWGGFVLK